MPDGQTPPNSCPRPHERINRDPVLAEGILVMGMPSPGGMQETTCLRLDLVHGWLFTIDESRVASGLRLRVRPRC